MQDMLQMYGLDFNPAQLVTQFACYKLAINLQKVAEVHSKIFFVQPNQMLTVLQKGEADTDIFRDSSRQP